MDVHSRRCLFILLTLADRNRIVLIVVWRGPAQPNSTHPALQSRGKFGPPSVRRCGALRDSKVGSGGMQPYLARA